MPIQEILCVRKARIFIVVSLLCMLFVAPIYAQKKLKEGAITYKVTAVKSDLPELQLMLGTKSVLYFTPTRQKTDYTLPFGGIRMQKIADKDGNKLLTIYDFGEKKYRVIPTVKDDTEKLKSALRYQSDPEEKKIIGGYSCRLVTVISEIGEARVWMTDKIKLQNPDFQRLFPNLDGFPLEYTVIGDRMKITFSAESVSDRIPADAFSVPADYPEISEKAFSKITGGMTFGF